ncbi:MAG TPA: hypothetical protein DDW26_05535, partial [Rhizobiales bacterium]|nr:hypothetical protein [Hyphomicrobiales bacterium]
MAEAVPVAAAAVVAAGAGAPEPDAAAAAGADRAAAGELPAAKVRHWAKQLAPATVGPPRASFAEMAMAWRSAMALGALATAAPSAMGFGVGSAGPAEVPGAVARMGA